MAKIIRQLTSISPRSGSPPGRRLLALMLCAMLAFGSVAPGFAIAGESDSEGEGTTPPIEVPVGPPDLDPGGEETGLEEEAPESAEEESTGVEAEVESEVEIEPPVPTEVTTQASEPRVEVPASPAPAPEPPAAAQPEDELKTATDPGEPVVNQSITAPEQESAEAAATPAGAGGNPASSSSPGSEASFGGSEAPAESEAPRAAQPPVAVPPRDSGPGLTGADTYVVRPGDCLWHIAAALLPPGSDTQAIGEKVRELWAMNKDRIGTGDPNLIYPGTRLRLR